MIISSISYSQTINAHIGDFESNTNPYDSSLTITLKIKLNEGESEILGHAHNVKLTFNSQALEYLSGTFLNFNEAQGYSPTLIFNPGQSPIILIDTELSTGTGTEIDDSYIDFLMIDFKIIDFSLTPDVCPKDNDFLFYSPGSHVAWTLGEWYCYEPNTPVELNSFKALLNSNNVVLQWSTATETNNAGFEVEKMKDENEFTKIGYVPGYRTTTEIKNYQFEDANLITGSYTYRLKQVDFNGSFTYSKLVNVDVTIPVRFELKQNYPNPFNPSTVINYQLAVNSDVTLKVYDILGKEVTTLVDEYKPAGSYKVEFISSSLSTGIYFYQLRAGSFTETKKMVLMK